MPPTIIGSSLGYSTNRLVGLCRLGDLLGLADILGVAGGELVGNGARRVVLGGTPISVIKVFEESCEPFGRENGSLSAGCGISSIVLTKVTTPLMYSAFFEPLTDTVFRNVVLDHVLVIWLEVRVPDVIPAPETVLKGLGNVGVVEVRGDPRANSPSRLKIRNGHRQIMMLDP